MPNKVKILLVDIETAPNVAYVWGVWKQNVGINQMKENGYIMSFAAKWLDDDSGIYRENRTGDDKELVEHLLELLDEADIVIAHNAKKFDLPLILGRAVVHNLKPPSPYKVVDTLVSARQYFRFPRYNLEYLAEVFGVAPKMKHSKFPGFELWLQCLKQNDEAWAEMQEYNIQDVITLEEVYLRMRPYILNHPNVGIFTQDDVAVCPVCGGKHLNKRGTYHTNLAEYQRFRCMDCGKWSRGRTNLLEQKARKALITNAL